MSKPPRVVVPGLPHHITHRGNRRSEIFAIPEDCQIYLRLLKKQAERNKVMIQAYAIMPNHVHLVAVPGDEESLSNMIQEAHGTFSQLFNGKHDLTGHTWEGRFFSCVLDPAHFWNAIRYVERNPVRAGLVKCAEDYRWSSAAAHCGFSCDHVLSPILSSQGEVSDWSAWLRGEDTPSIDRYIRTQTLAGHPCGHGEYFESWESRLGRRLLPRRRGRPPKMVK